MKKTNLTFIIIELIVLFFIIFYGYNKYMFLKNQSYFATHEVVKDIKIRNENFFLENDISPLETEEKAPEVVSETENITENKEEVSTVSEVKEEEKKEQEIQKKEIEEQNNEITDIITKELEKGKKTP